MCHHVPAEVYTLGHEGTSLLGITDTACAKAVAGTMSLQQQRRSQGNQFGTGAGTRGGSLSIRHWEGAPLVFPCGAVFQLGQPGRGEVVEMKVPLLMSKPGFDLVTTSSGHPAIPIVPAKPCKGPARLVVERIVRNKLPMHCLW